MVVNRLQFVKGIIIILACLFVAGVLLGIEMLSSYSKAFVFPFFSCLYFLGSEKTNNFFGTFLIAFSVAELVRAIWGFNYHLSFRVANLSYILAYLSLLIYMIRGVDFNKLFNKFKYHLTVLFVFNAYIIFVLNQMIVAEDSIQIYTMTFLIECLYNMCILLLLSFSLIKYLYHDSIKDLLLFLASVCIVFSEMVQVAYVFMSTQYILNLIYSLFVVIGFYFVYIHMVSKMNTFHINVLKR